MDLDKNLRHLLRYIEFVSVSTSTQDAVTIYFSAFELICSRQLGCSRFSAYLHFSNDFKLKAMWNIFVEEEAIDGKLMNRMMRLVRPETPPTKEFSSRNPTLFFVSSVRSSWLGQPRFRKWRIALEPKNDTHALPRSHLRRKRILL